MKYSIKYQHKRVGGSVSRLEIINQAGAVVGTLTIQADKPIHKNTLLEFKRHIVNVIDGANQPN